MRVIFLIIFFLIISFSGFSQDEESYVFGDNSTTTNTSSKNGFSWDRTTIGGGFGLSFGDFTVIDLAPNFGYYLTDNIIAGIGFRYTYIKDNDVNQSATTYGGRIFGEYLFDDFPLLAHVEAELINFQFTLNERKNIVNLLVGGGIKQAMGGGSYFFILVLYNLNQTKESFIFEPNPIIRGGIAIGL